MVLQITTGSSLAPTIFEVRDCLVIADVEPELVARLLHTFHGTVNILMLVSSVMSSASRVLM